MGKSEIKRAACRWVSKWILRKLQLLAKCQRWIVSRNKEYFSISYLVSQQTTVKFDLSERHWVTSSHVYWHLAFTCNFLRSYLILDCICCIANLFKIFFPKVVCDNIPLIRFWLLICNDELNDLLLFGWRYLAHSCRLHHQTSFLNKSILEINLRECAWIFWTFPSIGNDQAISVTGQHTYWRGQEE